ncbi:MAG: hypothetical protein Q9209_001965 [Squamulea sp. 1 TL-2023]
MFSSLPPDIRSMIWDLCLGWVAPTDYDHKDQGTEIVPITGLMVIYASKPINREVLDMYYRKGPFDLHICLGLQDRDLLQELVQERLIGRYTNFHLSFNGCMRSRNLADTNFSFFRSISLEITLAPTMKLFSLRHKAFIPLKALVSEFSEVVQEWQSRRPWWSKASCPRIGVTLDVPLSEETACFGRDFELDLNSLAELLKPLGDIDNCDDATIDARYPLGFGQEWVPEILGQITTNMRKESKDFEWVGRNIADAFGWSQHYNSLPHWPELAEVEILPCGPPERQADDEVIDLMDNFEIDRVFKRFLVIVITIELVLLDLNWTILWDRLS